MPSSMLLSDYQERRGGSGGGGSRGSGNQHRDDSSAPRRPVDRSFGGRSRQAAGGEEGADGGDSGGVSPEGTQRVVKRPRVWQDPAYSSSAAETEVGGGGLGGPRSSRAASPRTVSDLFDDTAVGTSARDSVSARIESAAAASDRRSGSSHVGRPDADRGSGGGATVDRIGVGGRGDGGQRGGEEGGSHGLPPPSRVSSLMGEARRHG